MPRGAKPGERRGGRAKGTPNKITLDVAARLESMGCDPLMGMAQLAMDVTMPPELRGRMFAELAQYLAPKRKAVDMTSSDGSAAAGPHEIVVKVVRPGLTVVGDAA